LCDFEKELDVALGAEEIEGYGGGGGGGEIRILNSMISRDNEWGSRLEGPNGLLLLLVSMFLVEALVGLS